MGDTPRTDAVAERRTVIKDNGRTVTADYIVNADFARTLERELAAANERAVKAEKQLASMGHVATGATEAYYDAEAAAAVLRERVATLAQDALEDVTSWGAYASEYFQKKWDFEGCVAKWRALATQQKEQSDE